MQSYDTIQLKRVYEEVEKSDGLRLLADRLWPRGIKKSVLNYDEWIKDLCPSSALRKAWHQGQLSFESFEQQYIQELGAHADALSRVAAMAVRGPVTLISAVKSLDNSHLPILKRVILEKMEDNEFNRSQTLASPVCYSSSDD